MGIILRLLPLFFFVQAFSVSAQDEILLINGHLIPCKVLEVQDTDIVYEYTKQKKNKSKTSLRLIDRYRVFSVKREGFKEEVFYKQDTTTGYVFTEEEMRYYIMGQQDATENHKATFSFIFGMLYGGAGGYILSENIIVLLVPFSTLPIFRIFGAPVRQKNVRDSQLLTKPTYVQGYKRVARSKTVLQGLLGALVGMAAGITAGNLAN